MKPQNPSRGATTVRWTLLILGGAGVVAGVLQFGAAAIRPGSSVDNPVFGNVRRLPVDETMLLHVSAYGVNVAMIAAWVLVLVAAAYAFALLLRACYASAPAATLTAGVFLAGSTIAGVLIGTSLLKVGEFALQAMSASPAEQAWLTPGINWLTQLHLFYVSAWMLTTGIGWLFLGAAAKGVFTSGHGRSAALAVRVAGLVFIVSQAARLLLPLAGPAAPALFVGLGEPLATLGFGLGFGGCGLLLGALRAQPATTAEAVPALR